MFRIGSEEFEVAESGIVAVADVEENEFFWAIDLYAQKKDTKTLGLVSPKLSFTELPNPENADRWLRQLDWKEANGYDDELGDWIGDFFIYDAHDFESRLSWKRTSYDKFMVEWSGVVDTAPQIPGQELKRLLEFSIAQEVPFVGIFSRTLDKDAASTFIGKFIDLESFECDSQSVEHPMLGEVLLFEPRSDEAAAP